MGNFFSSGEKRDREEIINKDEVTENEEIIVQLNSIQSDSNVGSSSKRIRVESSEQVSADYSTISMFQTDVHVTDVTHPIPTVTVTSIIETDVTIGGKKELTPREKNKARMKLKRDQQRKEETSVEKKSRQEFRNASQKEKRPSRAQSPERLAIRNDNRPSQAQ